MKIIGVRYFALFYFVVLTTMVGSAYSEEQSAERSDSSKTAAQTLAEQLANTPDIPQIKKKLRKKSNARLLSLYFDNEELVDVVNFLAAEKGVNVVLPVGAHAINNKVTLHYEERLPLDEAWKVLYTLLEVAGYSLIEKNETYTIVKIGRDIGREATPIYINVKPADLPNTDQRIRYLYYLTNIKVAEEGNSELNAILKDVLPETATHKFDTQSNAIIISDKANNIKQVMNIIITLDEAEVQDKPVVMQLFHVPAQWLSDLLNEHILRNTTDPNKLRLMDMRKQQDSFYFSRGVRIVPMVRNNRLVLLGKPQSVQRIKEFIEKQIDVDLDSGKSILHVYQLQYLDAEKFAPVLERIVETKKEGGTEQSKAEAEAGSFERYFGEVKIAVDQPKTASGEKSEGMSLGSNNLIVACRNDDWDHIKKLIEELDTPQPLVIIEVLIADLSTDDLRLLGSSVRNPAIINPPNVSYQSAQMQPMTTDSNTNPTTLAADLLRDAWTGGSPPPVPPTPGSDTSYLEYAAPGVTAVAFSDPATGATWSIWQLLQQFTSTRILAHPHVICTNNKKAEIIIKEERLLQDEASGTTGGTTTATRKWIPASLDVKITPRISSGNIVNLHVIVDISSFINAVSQGATNSNSGNRTDRNVTTNANVPSGSVLCLGGLSEINSANNTSRTPLLSQIPLIGWFFKERDSEYTKSSLTVFIAPTIIETRFRGGASNYTRDQVEFSKLYVREGALFDTLRDPITRWFFEPIRKDPQADLDEFIKRDEQISRDLAQAGTPEGGLITAQNTPLKPDLQRALSTREKSIVTAHDMPAIKNATHDNRDDQLRKLLAESDVKLAKR